MNYISLVLLLGDPGSVASSDAAERMLGATADGPQSDDLNHASIVTCINDGRLRCAHICSGTLIAPNAILTSSKCISSPLAPIGDMAPIVPVDRMFVYLGGPNVDSRSFIRAERLLKVSHIKAREVHWKQIYDADEDVGVVILQACTEGISPLKIATLKTESIESCSSVRMTGFQRGSTLPEYPFASVGQLGGRDGTTLDFATCTTSFKDINELSHGEETWPHYIVPDYHFCLSGEGAVCQEDLGTSVQTAMGGMPQIVGVVGIVHGGPTCGIGPKFAHRVAPMNKWIESVLRSAPVCAGWKVEDAFASWPLDDKPGWSEEYRASRCPDDRWQCKTGDMCIPTREVCDGTPDCPDERDESYLMCRGLPDFGRLKRSVVGEINSVADSYQVIRDDFMRLVRAHKSRRNGTQPPKGSVELIGSLTSIADLVRRGSWHRTPTRIGRRDTAVSEEYCQKEAGALIKILERQAVLMASDPVETLAYAKANMDVYRDACAVYAPCVDREFLAPTMDGSRSEIDVAGFCRQLDEGAKWQADLITYETSAGGTTVAAMCGKPAAKANATRPTEPGGYSDYDTYVEAFAIMVLLIILMLA